MRKRFSLRLGKFSLSYQELAPEIDILEQAAQGLANKRRAGAFAGEVEIASLRGHILDPDNAETSAPAGGIMGLSGVDAYEHAARSAEQDAAPRGTLIGVA